MPDTRFRDPKSFDDSGLHRQTSELVKDMSPEEMMVLIDRYCRADMLLSCLREFGFFPHKKTIQWHIEDKCVAELLE